MTDSDLRPGCPAHPTTGPEPGPVPLSEVMGGPDPHAVFRRLRAEWGDVAPVELEPGVNAWLVMGYKELRIITTREHLFSRRARHWRDLQNGVVAPDSGLGPMMFERDNVIGHDGAEHRRLRRPLDAAVAAIDQRRMRHSVEEMCAALIAGFADRGEADLVAEYAAVIPMLAVASQFGFDMAGGHELRNALIALFSSGTDSQAGNRRFEDILAELMRDHQATPADDLTTLFLDHPDLHNDAEVLQSIVVMVSAGNETTTSWIAQTIALMLTDPRFAGRLRGGRLGVDEALDEVLWAYPPMMQMPARYALRDTELGGRRIRKGDVLILGLAAANADPRIHTDGTVIGVPRSTPIELGNRAHLAWSAGPHACPAEVPARLITRTAVSIALHMLSDIRLTVPADRIPLVPSPWTRYPASLPITFTATRSPARPAAARRW
jgi:cytochrome P450